jgi:hypothetical protein
MPERSHEVKTYDVHVTREGKWWMVNVTAIDGLTQARRLSEVEDMARSLISVTLDVPPGTVGINVAAITIGGHDIHEDADHIQQLRDTAETMLREAQRASELMAKSLADEDVPVRDIGTVLQLSFQRASQLVATEHREGQTYTTTVTPPRRATPARRGAVAANRSAAGAGGKVSKSAAGTALTGGKKLAAGKTMKAPKIPKTRKLVCDEHGVP